MRINVLRIVIIIISVCLLALIVNALVGGWGSSNIKYYNELRGSYDFLPGFEDLGVYDDYSFAYYHDNMLLFSSDSYVLKVSYDEENYRKQKSLLDEEYVYGTDSLCYQPDEESPKDPGFKIDTFDMRVLSTAKYSLNYPKRLVFVGSSDETREIAYVCFIDHDLDYISKSFEDFIRYDNAW